MTDDRHIVLLFHSTDERDLLSFKGLGNVRPDAFEKMLRSLKQDFDIVGLERLIGTLRGGEKAGGRLLAITFDDGPKSYISRAVPLMESMGIPSTCFLITDCIGDRAIYWRYLFNFCLQRGLEGALTALVSAEYGVSVPKGEIISFTRGNFAKVKHERVVGEIFSRMVSEESYRDAESGLFLSEEDIAALKENPLVSFGVHTRTHPVLRHLHRDEIKDELEGSVDYYRERIRDERPMLSVPFGRLSRDYDERTVLAARDLSIDVVLSAYGGCNRPGQPLYNVRRIPVREEMWEGGQFTDEIERMCEAEEYAAAEERLCQAVEGGKKGPWTSSRC